MRAAKRARPPCGIEAECRGQALWEMQINAWPEAERPVRREAKGSGVSARLTAVAQAVRKKVQHWRKLGGKLNLKFKIRDVRLLLFVTIATFMVTAWSVVEKHVADQGAVVSFEHAHESDDAHVAPPDDAFDDEATPDVELRDHRVFVDLADKKPLRKYQKPGRLNSPGLVRDSLKAKGKGGANARQYNGQYLSHMAMNYHSQTQRRSPRGPPTISQVRAKPHRASSRSRSPYGKGYTNKIQYYSTRPQGTSSSGKRRAKQKVD